MNPLQLLNKLCIFLLLGFRPFLGPAACRYSIGCTQFAVMQLQEHNFFKASWIIFKRLIACNPFNRQQ